MVRLMLNRNPVFKLTVSRAVVAKFHDARDTVVFRIMCVYCSTAFTLTPLGTRPVMFMIYLVRETAALLAAASLNYFCFSHINFISF